VRATLEQTEAQAKAARVQVQEELLDARSQLAETSVQAHLKLIEIERLTGERLSSLPQTP